MIKRLWSDLSYGWFCLDDEVKTLAVMGGVSVVVLSAAFWCWLQTHEVIIRSV